MLAKENVVSEIDVKEAVRLAKEFAKGIYASEKISQLGLEAVERTEDGKYWLVTLGFSRPWTAPRSTREATTILYAEPTLRNRHPDAESPT